MTKISSYKDLPQAPGPLARREERLAWALLLPTLSAVALVVILPLIAIFWISFKPIELADLRAPVPVVKEDLRGKLQALGDQATLRYSCLLYTSPSPRDATLSRMPSSA